MKNLLSTDLQKSKKQTTKTVSLTGVKLVLATLFLTAFVAVSCSKEDAQDNTSNTETTKKISTADRMYYDSIIVHAWGSHNIDCSQPNGFCYEVWTITYSFLRPLPDGSTPVKIQNVNGAFVMKFFKSALTEENRRTLLRNGNTYNIPEGQTIAPELVQSLGFRSNTLRSGNYRIVEDENAFTIALATN